MFWFYTDYIVSDIYMIVVIGEFKKYDLLREELLVILVRTIFCGRLFYVGIGKNALIWYKAYVLNTRNVEKCQSAEILLIRDLG